MGTYAENSDLRPVPVPHASWQAGVTPRNWRKKVMLDGEPLPLAFAAGNGWVLCHPEPRVTPVPFEERAPLGLEYLIDGSRDRVLLTGSVQIIPGDRV